MSEVFQPDIGGAEDASAASHVLPKGPRVNFAFAETAVFAGAPDTIRT
jgi:hypothetical protein